MVFGIIPECRSASLRNERSTSPESPLWLIECKAGRTVHPAMANSILALRRAATSKKLRSLLVYRPSASAPSTRVIAPDIEAIDVQELIVIIEQAAAPSASALSLQNGQAEARARFIPAETPRSAPAD
jgi:hypothetical protein